MSRLPSSLNRVDEAAKELLHAARTDYGHNPYCKAFWRDMGESDCNCCYLRISKAADKLASALKEVA